MVLLGSFPLYKEHGSFPMGWKSLKGRLCRLFSFLLLQSFLFSKHFKIMNIKYVDFSTSSHLDLAVMFVKM